MGKDIVKLGFEGIRQGGFFWSSLYSNKIYPKIIEHQCCCYVNTMHELSTRELYFKIYYTINKFMNEMLLPQVLALLERDLDLEEAIPHSNNFALLREWLSGLISHLLERDLNYLLLLLYRLDISEHKAMLALSNQTDLSPPLALADMVIERELQKIQTRLQYSRVSDAGFSDDSEYGKNDNDDAIIADRW